MQRIGTFALTVAAVLAIQGCVLLPDEDHSFDPFFSNPDDNRNTSYIPVSRYMPTVEAPARGDRNCAVNMQPGAADQGCWYFPVMRFY